jgi:hypothetical protein
MIYLGTRYKGALAKRSDIAKDEGIPKQYLENILLILRKSGLISTARGANGGFALAKPVAWRYHWNPSAITTLLVARPGPTNGRLWSSCDPSQGMKNWASNCVVCVMSSHTTAPHLT